MKKIILITYLALFITNVSFCFANKDITYTTLAPIKSQGIGETMVIKGDTFSSYVENLYRIGITVAVGLAVIMVMWGGVEYITSDALGGKEGGKEKISQAFTGLLLALGSFLILNTIDKNLINTELNIQEIGYFPANINPLTGKPWNLNFRAREGNPYLETVPEYQDYQNKMNSIIAGITGESVSGWGTEFGYRDSEDNGVGSALLGDGHGKGVLTDNPNVLGVAIPMEALRAYFNIEQGDNSLSSWEPVRRAAVEITGSNGVPMIVPIVDIGPGQGRVSNGVVVDQTHALNAALGGDGDRTYRIIPNYYPSYSDRPVNYVKVPPN